MSQEFSWNDAEDCLVLRRQEPTAVYLNPHGAVVIRQEDSFGHDDAVIVIEAANVEAVAQAMLRCVEESRAQQKRPPEPIRLIQRAENSDREPMLSLGSAGDT